MADGITEQDYLLSNPFTPVFGGVPPFMAGRSQIIHDMASVFARPDNNPDRCSLFVGARGTGKTALLTYLSHEAEKVGWITSNVTSSPHMLEDILLGLVHAASHLLPSEPKRRLTGIGVSALGSLSWENLSNGEGTWRTRMNAILDALAETDTGVLITVDEVDPSLEEMAQLVTVYQHFVREGRKVSLLLAGLPHRMSSLLSGTSTSFLRRAAQHKLGSIPRYEVEDAFRLTVETAGRTIDDDALQLATSAIGGFPFMFQLVGYRSWNAAGTKGELDTNALQTGIRLAREELTTRVFDATYAELSKGDISFLSAMALLGERATRGELAEKLGKKSGYVSTYKRRLLEAGVIEEPDRGIFVFALPGFGDYVRGRAR